MKLHFTYIALFILHTISVEAQTVWHNPAKSTINPINGQYWQEEKRSNIYNRFPDDFERLVRPILWQLSKDTAGESITFQTDSPTITVRYHLTRPLSSSDYTSHTGGDGLDLYAKDGDGKEIWVVGDRNFADTTTYLFTPINYKNIKDNKGYKFELYLPYNNSIDWLEIGIDGDKFFQFLPSRKELPIAIYGSSSTQGIAATRPALTWSTQLSRRTDTPVINLGFSGNGKLEENLVDILAEIDAKIFIIDCMSDLHTRAASQLSRLIYNQVLRIRRSNPTTPIILTDHFGFPQSEAYLSFLQYETSVITAQKSAFEQLKKDGVTEIYHLTKEMLNIPNDATIDGLNLSDYGMKLYADAYEQLINQLLNTTEETTKQQQ